MGHPNLTKSELRKVAATARALAASAEAEIGARPAPFPAELRPALVMQWLPLYEAAAAFSVSGSWREDAEQYFRRYAQREGIPRGDSWYASVRCQLWNSTFTDVQRRVFMYYAKHWAMRQHSPQGHPIPNFIPSCCLCDDAGPEHEHPTTPGAQMRLRIKQHKSPSRLD